MKFLLDRNSKDKRWLAIWLAGLLTLGLWDVLFLNRPALNLLMKGLGNTVIISLLVIAFSLLLGWLSALALYFLEQQKVQAPYLGAVFLLNIIRSVPQIVGILGGYILLTVYIQSGALQSRSATLILIALVISLFVFLEVGDLIRERIVYFKERDFFNAMLVCGIREGRIINREILWKNSLPHIFNKLISIFGMSIFLLCSIDFIISVGLSREVSSVNLPVTLGNLLARIDSKQDILAIGTTLTDPAYLPNLFFAHLQGISVAALIVFTLLCLYHISNGFSRRLEI